MVDSLEAYFPAGSPVVHLLKAPAAFLESEGAHLKDGGVFQEGSEVIEVISLFLSNSIFMKHLQHGKETQRVSETRKRCLTISGSHRSSCCKPCPPLTKRICTQVKIVRF